jgi:hypothetical protein
MAGKKALRFTQPVSKGLQKEITLYIEGNIPQVQYNSKLKFYAY